MCRFDNSLYIFVSKFKIDKRDINKSNNIYNVNYNKIRYN